jgi:hypothetical protein
VGGSQPAAAYREPSAGQPGPRAENREQGPQEPRWNVAVECGLCRDRKVDSKGQVHRGVWKRETTGSTSRKTQSVPDEPKLAAAVGLESPTYVGATEQNATNEATDAREIVPNEPKLAAAVGLESPTSMDACRSENEPGVRSGFAPPFSCAPPRLTSRAVTCALPSQFADRVVTVAGELHRYKAPRIGDLWPQDC